MLKNTVEEESRRKIRRIKLTVDVKKKRDVKGQSNRHGTRADER